MTSLYPLISLMRGFLLSMNYDKPFKTYDELIEIMISRNIEVSNYDFAINALSNISYYTLINGYKDTFLSLNGSDMFVPGTKFEELYTIHILDTNLSSILLKYILHIEHSLKSKISYIISKKYGVFTDVSKEYNKNKNDYLYIKNYSPSNNKRRNILQKINQCGVESRNNLSLIHYKEKKNHIPPWILIGNVPFGLAIQWYSILKNNEKTFVCEQLVRNSALSVDNKKEFLQKALSISKDYRNSMAHGIRTFSNITVNELPKIPVLSLAPSLLCEKEYLSGLGKNDLFAVVIIICVLLNDSYLADNFKNDLIFLFVPYLEKDIRFSGKTILEVFGMPDNLIDRIDQFNHETYQS